MDNRKKRVLSLFSGCGGMDLGFEGNFDVYKESINENLNKNWIKHVNGNKITLAETSFETVFANDILEYAKSSWVPFFSSRGIDNRIFHTESIVDLVKKHKDGETVFPVNIDVVTGGFPCQDFSLSGKRLGFDSHKNHYNKKNGRGNPTTENRGSLYVWMKEVVEITKPKVFIAENVKGLVSLGNVKEIIENDFRKVDKGYIVVPAQVLNAKNYGVPQNRERVVFIGLSKRYLNYNIINDFKNNKVKNDILPYPTITHGQQLKSASKNEIILPYVNLKTIFQDLNEPEKERIDIDQQSYSKAKYYGKMQGNTEIKPNNVGPTIRSEHHGNIEFRRLSKENGGVIFDELDSGLIERRLTIRECARIQSFPDTYEFIRPRNKKDAYSLSASGAYKVIGNAVPPLLAYHLAKRLEDIWPNLFGEF
jgi:DNA (cytosine-5)-methyltransferase 1